MIEEFIKGFISVPIDLYNSIGPQEFYMLGRIIGTIFVISIIAVIFVIVMNLLGAKNEHDGYDYYDFM